MQEEITKTYIIALEKSNTEIVNSILSILSMNTKMYKSLLNNYNLVFNSVLNNIIINCVIYLFIFYFYY